MTVPAAEQLAADLYSKLMCPKIGPFGIVEILPSTVTIDRDGIIYCLDGQHNIAA